jgi:teichuronic acid biosynthesis glycosyltransferase TuaH
MKQRPQQLMKQFARLGHTVFYCNKNAEELPVEQLEPNLNIVRNPMRWLEQEWPAIRRKQQEPVIVWCSFPKLSSQLKLYAPDKIIYDCVDEFAEWVPYEHDMCMMADALVCTSQRLYERLSSKYPGKPLELVRNAYDPDMCLHRKALGTERPNDLPQGPLVGYIGAWAPWVDALLVNSLSRYLDQERIVIIGPEFGRKYGRSGNGVHYLGMKPHEQLPAYLAQLSVCIIPFRINPITLATNPVKAYEYLAAGKPVVSTNLPECTILRPYVDVSTSRTMFAELVKQRLADPGDRESRTLFALNQTWEHRVRQIEAFLNI